MTQAKTDRRHQVKEDKKNKMTKNYNILTTDKLLDLLPEYKQNTENNYASTKNTIYH